MILCAFVDYPEEDNDDKKREERESSSLNQALISTTIFTFYNFITL